MHLRIKVCRQNPVSTLMSILSCFLFKQNAAMPLGVMAVGRITHLNVSPLVDRLFSKELMYEYIAFPICQEAMLFMTVGDFITLHGSNHYRKPN